MNNLTWPVTGASALPRFFSRLTLASASSPKMDLAYRLAAMNPHSPDRAYKKRWMTKTVSSPHFDILCTLEGVRHFMLVDLRRPAK